MAAKHYIDIHSFQFWRTGPPATVQRQGESFTRVGQNVVGKILTGKRGMPFEAVTEEDFQTYDYAMAYSQFYSQLPFSGPKRIVYNDIDYLAMFGHLYWIDSVEVVQCLAMPRIVGPDYDYTSGARVTVRWMMTPLYIEPDPTF